MKNILSPKVKCTEKSHRRVGTGTEVRYWVNDRHHVSENRDRNGQVLSYIDTVYNDRGGVDWSKGGFSPACPCCREREVNAWIDGGKLRICKNKKCPRYVE